jgi:hypothetical protein
VPANRIVIALQLILSAALTGCAVSAKPAKVPSTAAVRTNMEAAKQNIEQAAAAVKAAGGDNTELRDLTERMERKTIIIDRWLETNP